MKLLIVTGMSGSGKSGAVNVLEDLGYYCIDNMPPELIPKFAEICNKSEGKLENVAICVDVRGGELFFKLNDNLQKLKRRNISYKVMFLDATDESLIKRYKETRRKHPLDEDVGGNLHRAILEERQLLSDAREVADYYIDTSEMAISDLKQRLKIMFTRNDEMAMSINIMSFGFKHGYNSEADLIFDVRCLPNPFYVEKLKMKTGLDSEVANYVMQFEQSRVLKTKLFDLIDFLIPLYIDEGKAQLVIAFGCTGGKHRSVTFAEMLKKHLEAKYNGVRIEHRDILK